MEINLFADDHGVAGERDARTSKATTIDFGVDIVCDRSVGNDGAKEDTVVADSSTGSHFPVNI